MRSKTSILALEWMPVSVAGGVRKAVGGFLRYVEYRDQHPDGQRRDGLDAYVRYVAHRDRTSARGRIFGRDGNLTDADRHRLVDFVARSTRGLKSIWRRNREGELEDHQRAVYQMIVSPEDWRGLDLRPIARAAMRQLEEDAGEKGLGPWFAAEHRNTEHHHVHIVLAARREVAPGKYSTLLITRPRLKRMKDAVALEIDRQRSLEMDRVINREPSQQTSLRVQEPGVKTYAAPRWHWEIQRRVEVGQHRHPARQQLRLRVIGPTLFRLRALARHYHQRQEHELERESARAEREGWVR